MNVAYKIMHRNSYAYRVFFFLPQEEDFALMKEEINRLRVANKELARQLHVDR